MSWSPEDISPDAYEFEPEAFLIPPMEGFLRRIFGARWGIILVSAPSNVRIMPILDFLANYSLQLAYYSQFSAEEGDLESLQREKVRLRTMEEILKEAQAALPHDDTQTETPSAGEDVVRHVPRNPEYIFLPDLNIDTVSEAVQAALSGHLVIAGIHAEGSFPALGAFRDLAGSNHLVAASLMGIIGLNTVPRICPECRVEVEYEVTDQDAFLLGASQSKLRGFRGMGCEECGQTGFCGRILIHEGFEISEKLRADILGNVPLRRLRMSAKREGMVTLLDAAWTLVEAGETILEEVVRIADVTDPGSDEDIGEAVGEG